MKKSLLFSFSLIGVVGFTTAIPLVALGLSGRYFDQKLGTAPYLFLTSLAVATIIVYFALRQIVKQAIQEFNRINLQK